MKLLAGILALLLSTSGLAATVTASWDPPTTNVDGSPAVIDGYKISYQCTSVQGTTPADRDARSKVLELPDGERCQASMVAYNAGGESAPSNTVTFTTAPLERPGRVTNLRISWTERPTEPVPTMDLIFSDNFNRANSGNLGANWQNVLGSPAVASNQARKGTLSAFDESMALVSNWSQVEALEIRATTGGAGGGANPAIVFAQRLGVDMVVGFILYFGTEGANLYFYDDITETYGVVATGVGIGTLTGVQVALSIETVGSALQFRAYRRDNDATTLTYTAPLASLPAHFNAPKPGLGFYDEASNTPWVDNFEVWVPSSGLTATGDLSARWGLTQLAAQDAPLEWSISERVDGRAELLWLTHQQAEAYADTLWSVHQHATALSDLQWDLTAQISELSPLRWAVAHQSGAVGGLQWGVWEQVDALSEPRWTLAGRVDALSELGWDLNQQMLTLAELRWDVLSNTSVSASDELRWNVLSQTAAGHEALWNLLQSTGASGKLPWDVFRAAVTNAELRWSLAAAALANLDLGWSVEGASGEVSNRLALRWSLASTIAASIESQWALFAQVARGVDLEWDDHELAGDLTSIRWDSGGRVATELDARWGILNRAWFNVDLRWGVLSQITSDLAQRWDVIEAIQAGASLRWSLVGRTASDLTLQWVVHGLDTFDDIVGTITLRRVTPTVSVVSRTPVIEVASATPKITIH